MPCPSGKDPFLKFCWRKQGHITTLAAKEKGREVFCHL